MLIAVFRRFLPLVCFICCLVSPSFARSRFWGYAEQGGKQVLTGGQLSTSPRVQGSYPNATVTVRNPDNTLATIYSDLAGTAKSNPFVADQTGFWFYYADGLGYNNTFSGAGIATPFSIPVTNTSNWCNYDTQYTTLAAAINSIAANGCLVVTGTWTLTAPVINAASNISIHCQPGSSFNTGANGIMALLQFTGNNVHIDGCTFDGQFTQHAYAGVYGGIYTNNVTGFEATGNTFRNMSGWALFLDVASYNAHLAHNTYTNIGNGVVGGGNNGGGILSHNPGNLAIEYETCQTLTSDNCIHIFAGAITAGPTQGSWSIDHVWADDLYRLGIEASTVRTQASTFTNNHITHMHGNTAVSITQVGASGVSTAPEQQLLVDGNFVYNPLSMPDAGYCYELFSNHILATNNTCWGPWDAGIIYTGSARISHNDITGTRLGVAASAPDTDYVGSSLLIDHNQFHEIMQYSISGGLDSVTIDNNFDYRTPGYFSIDGTGNAAVHVFAFGGNSNQTASGAGGANLVNNTLVVASAVIPVGFVVCMNDWNNSGTAGNLYEGNTMINLGSTKFGSAFCDPPTAYSRVQNNKWVGINAINDGSYNPALPVTSGGNISLAGNTGATPATGFTISRFYLADFSKIPRTYSGLCLGTVASGSNVNSIIGLGGVGPTLACNAGASTYITEQLTQACTIQNLNVSSNSAGAGAGDGVMTVYAGAGPTTVTCTIGTGTTCTDSTHQAGISAGNKLWVNTTTTGTSLSYLAVSFQCVPI